MDIFETSVREFNATFQPSQDEALWVKLVDEELAEVREAAAHLLKELADFLYVAQGLAIVTSEQRANEVLEERNLDLVYALMGGFADLKRDAFLEAFKRVHASNMSKLDDNGQVIRREDGKVMKGPNYKPPVLDDLVS